MLNNFIKQMSLRTPSMTYRSIFEAMDDKETLRRFSIHVQNTSGETTVIPLLSSLNDLILQMNEGVDIRDPYAELIEQHFSAATNRLPFSASPSTPLAVLRRDVLTHLHENWGSYFSWHSRIRGFFLPCCPSPQSAYRYNEYKDYPMTEYGLGAELDAASDATVSMSDSNSEDPEYRNVIDVIGDADKKD